MSILHAKQVADLAGGVARKLGLDRASQTRAVLGGWLHDVGKLAIPDTILGKPGPLSDGQWVVMRQHAEIGARIVELIPGLEETAPIVYHHHERWDGTGYPDRLAGTQIPIEARIVASADAYSALTSDRVYKHSVSTAAALAELHRSATTHLDPSVVEALAAVIALKPTAVC